ncbi:endonuclease/exonuclease/phosphatase family protein [Saccharibacter floricola]|uniref:Endonuclease/exonuclease/phosphatase domain-containing protein n=1 Tax=Saccharibacter floricola DSM 15669 TaxID=1123227 RepID=A0ABQ0NYV0_9PROT|nr:endonuclease/exonuclease/phosphatase family protein [Saccharibacter floricola]GBQ06882.1 hypothetical protein AA15669_1131 [Saccharibacter floricola DSM 15669]
MHPRPSLLWMLGRVVLFLCVCLPTEVQAHPLKITTWNLDWLTDRPSDDPDLPADIPHRSDHDRERLRHYAQKLNSDIIALQEVDDTLSAEHLFDPSLYSVIMIPDPIVQRVGLAIRRPLNVTLNPELSALDVSRPHAQHHLRAGLDVTLHDGDASLRLLVVHLKAGCWERPLAERKHSCPTLYQQFHIIENWILDRQDDGMPFVILGDFNRRLVPNDPLMKQLNSDASLTLTTAGYASPCRGGKRFIDHIILGNSAQNWLIPDSLRVMTYRDDRSQKGLSDHCPVSVKLSLP